LATTAALVLAHATNPGDEEDPSLRGALLIGFAQGLAVLPGLSRSGSTIAVALLLGVRRERAFELSMLMSLPAILGAVVLEARHAFAEPFAFGPALFGALIAFGTGLFALDLLRRLVVRGAFGWFAFWVGPLSLATIGRGIAWPP
jgi:undecaprenyl-diphosphatase